MNTPPLHNLNAQLSLLLSTVGVGVWDWNLTTGHVIYSDAWAQVLGYRTEELPPNVTTWERMLVPEDLAYANEQIEKHLSGKSPLYEAEFRMVCKDGSIIWAQDRGQVFQYDADGTPIRFMGVLQNVSRLKNAEQELLEKQETLDLAVHVASLGTWDWDIEHNYIRYNDEYLSMVGYSQSDINGSIEEWRSMTHPEDLPRAMQLLDAYLSGAIPAYECEIRIVHRDGTYLWTRDVGKIVARDANGKPTRLIGGHLNIDALKSSKMNLKEALDKLEDNNSYLTSQMEHRTRELLEQDKLLWTVNQISRKLLAFQPTESFESLVRDCLCLLGNSINKNRIYIWKDFINENGTRVCTQIYEWVRDVPSIQGDESFARIPYDNLPSFSQAIDNDCCLNSLLCDLAESEREILAPQGIKTILIAPIAINGRRWGFIGVDNCETEQLFTSVQENMLMMSGSMLANTIEKIETEAALREMEERTQIMLNATPLCCNLWTPEFHNMSCNDEAVRLFELSSQEEYLERFNELSPEYQPCGRPSGELAAEYIAKAFDEGYCRFEWLHQKFDGTPIPAEITLVRIKYRGGFIVAGYTRDLREQKAMLAELRSKEDDLRTARDEALLSSKAKSNFLANMSHEIRTPMNAISGLSEIILRESTNEKTAEYAKGIRAASNNLLNLINDILDISKVESGKLEIFNAPYELASLLNDVITVSRIRLGSKPLMFLADIDSRLPAHLVGDELRIKQILINMLSNAIKFTQEGYIALRVTGTVENGCATLYFSVKDSGVGIKQEDMQRLFAEFERVNTTKNRSIEGTGLGLAISKHLCEMMHGRIEVQSVYGEGSEFTATFPQACPVYERLTEVAHSKNVLLYEPRELYRRSIAHSIANLDCTCAPCANQSELYENITAAPYDYILTPSLHVTKMQSILKKNKLTVPIAAFSDYGDATSQEGIYTILFPVNCLQLADLFNGRHAAGNTPGRNADGAHFAAPTARVLVVDDSPVNLQVAKGLMEPYRFTIDTAQNGIEAIEMVKSTEYDLVFMDHMMPEMDGIDATVAIRQLSGSYYQALPIIALTANALVGTREMFLREGMNDFLAKPIDMTKLTHILLKWLPREKISTTQAPPPPAHSDAAVWDIEGLHMAQGILSVGGSLENYLQIARAYYEDGVQKCTSLLQHVTANNLDAFRTEVHALKSTSATIGALELSAHAAKLEAAAQKRDALFVNDNLDAFLTAFKTMLEAIHAHLPPLPAADASAGGTAGGTQGDPAYLQAALQDLQNAAELANIGQLEKGLAALQGFAWCEPVAKELAAMREALAQFDYDGVLECVLRIRQ